jgi:hypothetical protein
LHLTLRSSVTKPRRSPSSGDPARLLDQLREASQGRDVHLAGGPRAIEAFLALGALDKLELVVLPLLFGAGTRLTPPLSPDTGPAFERERALQGGLADRLRPAIAGWRRRRRSIARPGPCWFLGAVDVHALAVDAASRRLDNAYRRGTAQRRDRGTACGERGDCAGLCLPVAGRGPPITARSTHCGMGWICATVSRTPC